MPELSLVKETFVRWKGQRRELTWGHLCSLVLQSLRRQRRRRRGEGLRPLRAHPQATSGLSSWESHRPPGGRDGAARPAVLC